MTVSRVLLCAALIAGLSPGGVLRAATPGVAERWQAEYAGDDATGSHVIALWQFGGEHGLQDASGHGHELTLQGAKVVDQGRFGAGLESFRGWPDDPGRHAATSLGKPDLSPLGAFTAEMWIKAKAELKGYPDAFLIDKKYVSDNDYQFILTSEERWGGRRLRVGLGFGSDSETYNSNSLRWEPDVWYHVAFTYDGAGTVKFYRNAQPLGGATRMGRGKVSPGTRPLSIGDRIGSYYHGFPGYIDQVRISRGVLQFGPASLAVVSRRTAFVRMEQAPPLRLLVTNRQRTVLKHAQVRIDIGGQSRREFKLPELEPGGEHAIEYPLDLSLRPDRYALNVAISIDGDEPYTAAETFPLTIVSRPLPRRMPVVMWGVGGVEGVVEEMARLKQLGFTHCLGLNADYGAIWKATGATAATSPDALAGAQSMLNEALANDLGIVISLSPGRWLGTNSELQRVNREGKPHAPHDVCASFPEAKQFCYNVGQSVAETYGEFPAFQAALIHTEVRGESQVCFHDHDRQAFRRFAGFDIPEEVASKNGVSYQKLTGFPRDRVIPDDHPLYVYFKWFWKTGDGWNQLHTAVHNGLKSAARPGFWTFHDPAVRAPSVWGSGGNVDFLSQWTYSYPDPIRIALATDELLAMTRGASRPQQVMKMTQIIWYRSQTAPAPGRQQATEPASAWEDADPDADFVTMAPMHLREAFWTKISRPIQGIMYHGWQSLVPTESPSAYRYTHPETRHELERLVHEVVQPLGPTLMQVPAKKSDVAFLESFAAQMFARRGTYGWNHGWAGNMYHALQYAQLPSDVVYDETIVEQGLDDYRVLVLADCDVLTRTVAERIRQFQQRGGIVIGDERLAPVIEPDVRVQSRERTQKASEDNQALLQLAAQLREQIGEKYRRHVDSSNPQVVTHCRRYGGTDYVFVVNDHREFGRYVGHHGLVMENGLPSEATLTIARPQATAYDLVAHRLQPAVAGDGATKIAVRLGPCEGRVYMLTERPIDRLQIDCPKAATLGEQLACRIAVLDKQGEWIDAVIPLEVQIVDPDGRAAEFGGFYGATNGRVQIDLHLAPNDVPGLWRLRVRCLASGLEAEHYLRVTQPTG